MASILKARSVVVVPRQINIEVQERTDYDNTAKKLDIPEIEPELSLVENDGLECETQSEETDNLYYFDPNDAYEAKINQALEDAKAIIAQAEADANNILQVAQEDRKKILENAHAEGYNLGYSDGMKAGSLDAKEEVAKTLDELAYFIEMLKMERMQTLEDEEKSLLALSFEIAQKVMRQQAKVDKSLIPQMVADVVREQESAVRVILTDYNQTLDCRIDEDIKEKIKMLLPGVKVQVVPNDGVDELIQIETSTGMVDVGVKGQLDRLKEAVADQRRNDFDD